MIISAILSAISFSFLVGLHLGAKLESKEWKVELVQRGYARWECSFTGKKSWLWNDE